MGSLKKKLLEEKEMGIFQDEQIEEKDMQSFINLALEEPMYSSISNKNNYTCSKCKIQDDDVHECMNCDIHLCVDCDENEMPLGADDHTYCTPCVSKLFTEKDYDDLDSVVPLGGNDYE